VYKSYPATKTQPPPTSLYTNHTRRPSNYKSQREGKKGWKIKKKVFQNRLFRCVLYDGVRVKPANVYGEAKNKNKK